MNYCFCFFKQKTAYELRISDWSSDVCSSDLHIGKRAIINPMSDFRPYRAPARPPLGNAGRARLSGDYQQDANTLDQRLRHCLIKTLMGKRQTSPMQVARYFRPPHAALQQPLPATAVNSAQPGPANQRIDRR